MIPMGGVDLGSESPRGGAAVGRLVTATEKIQDYYPPPPARRTSDILLSSNRPFKIGEARARRVCVSDNDLFW